jgi:hypothetical protein
MAIKDMIEGGVSLSNGVNEVIDITPDWLRNPASIEPIESVSKFKDKANSYFSECVDIEIRATITGFCLAVGLPGPTSLIRLGQRVPELRHTISCCMTAISHGYEQMIGTGNAAGPLFMLKNIPDFDPEEPIGSPGVQFFNDKKEILLQTEVIGAVTTGKDFDGDVDPLDIYLSIIQKQNSTVKGLVNVDVKGNSLLDKVNPGTKPVQLLRIIDEVEIV